MWFNIAASNGSQFGVMTRNMVEKKMTAGDISKAQELARNCVAKQYKGCLSALTKWSAFIGSALTVSGLFERSFPSL